MTNVHTFILVFFSKCFFQNGKFTVQHRRPPRLLKTTWESHDDDTSMFATDSGTVNRQEVKCKEFKIKAKRIATIKA